MKLWCLCRLCLEVIGKLHQVPRYYEKMPDGYRWIYFGEPHFQCREEIQLLNSYWPLVHVYSLIDVYSSLKESESVLFIGGIPSLKLTFSPLKMDGWNTSFLLGWPMFRGEVLVLGSVPPSLTTICSHELSRGYWVFSMEPGTSYLFGDGHGWHQLQHFPSI